MVGRLKEVKGVVYCTNALLLIRTIVKHIVSVLTYAAVTDHIVAA